MNATSKLAKARDMARLIEDARQKSYHHTNNLPTRNVPRSSVEALLCRLRTEIYTDLYARHLSEDDLDRLYEFYNTEAGSRILVGLQIISQEYQRSLRRKLRNISASSAAVSIGASDAGPEQRRALSDWPPHGYR